MTLDHLFSSMRRVTSFAPESFETTFAISALSKLAFRAPSNRKASLKVRQPFSVPYPVL